MSQSRDEDILGWAPDLPLSWSDAEPDVPSSPDVARPVPPPVATTPPAAVPRKQNRSGPQAARPQQAPRAPAVAPGGPQSGTAPTRSRRARRRSRGQSPLLVPTIVIAGFVGSFALLMLMVADDSAQGLAFAAVPGLITLLLLRAAWRMRGR